MADEIEDSPVEAGPTAADLELIAYALWPGADMPIVPAFKLRNWMDATHVKFAYRCLPLLMANQSGWFVLNSQSLRVYWNGDDSPTGLEIMYQERSGPFPAASIFGYGILTFHIPYLFRTPVGYNLLARGPANWPKDGIAPLEGLVETDWAVATFTMNWQVTRPEQVIGFEKGEPICMIVPQRRGELESISPKLVDVQYAPDLARSYHRWATSRRNFRGAVRLMRPPSAPWQKHYFFGGAPDGTRAPEHERKRKIRPFSGASGEDTASESPAGQ